MNKENNSQIFKSSFVIGITIFLSAVSAAYAFYSVKAMDDAVVVTGSAKKSVISDQVNWSVNFMRPITLDTVKDGYVKMNSDLKVVKDFFAKNGFVESDLTISPVLMNEVYESNTPAGAAKKYDLVQTISISSVDVKKVDLISKNIQELVLGGVIVNPQSPQYYYSGLQELKVSLLPEALKDAKTRAEAIVKLAGSSVGKIKSAGAGVVQVLSPGSSDVSDYGSYDTSSINKDVMVTVRASFQIK
ncbi:MAG: SIMPL domain-containing protein [bacterium]